MAEQFHVIWYCMYSIFSKKYTLFPMIAMLYIQAISQIYVNFFSSTISYML